MRILAATLLALSTTVSAQAKVERPPQFVALAFDGSRNLDFWKESRAFARETGVRFTYFISGVYFLARKDRKLYREPQRGRGRSAIGYGGKAADIAERVEQVALAVSDGHEIASHANGHYNGAKYSSSQWKLELDQFETIMTNSWSRYSDLAEPDWWREYFTKEIKGLRAPELGRGPGLFRALKAKGYAYDTSRTAKPGYWPEQINGVWNFPLANLRLSGTRRGTLSMDYNFYVADSGARRGPSGRFKRFEDRMFNTYMNYFKYNYSGNGNRAPVDIGHHFSAWNGGAYWRAMKRFTKAVCFKPEVICGTYSELHKFVEDNRKHLSDYRNGNFDKSNEPSSLVMAYATPPAITKTYQRQEPVVVATLSETLNTAESSIPTPKAAAREPITTAPTVAKLAEPDGVRITYDSDLRGANLSAMSKAELKAYWTLVWYKNQGRKMPLDEARALGIEVPGQPATAKIEPAKPSKPDPIVKKAEEQPKPLPQQEASVAPEKMKAAPPAPKNDSAASTNTAPSATEVAKATEPETKPAKDQAARAIYDAGIRRPNLAALNAAERKAYWTKVWLARRDRRRVRQGG